MNKHTHIGPVPTHMISPKGDMLPYDEKTFPILARNGWRVARQNEQPVRDETGYMVNDNGDIYVYNPTVVKENSKFRPAKQWEVDEWKARFSIPSARAGVQADAPTAVDVAAADTAGNPAQPDWILRDGTDISTMKATDMREYAKRMFDPDPAWAGNMSTEAIRSALYDLDWQTAPAGVGPSENGTEEGV